MFDKISRLGGIKVLINNAGDPSFKMPTEYSKKDIDICFKVLEGMILCSTEALKLKQEKDLKIVNIMFSAALRGNKQEVVYCAIKWGEKGYTESLKTAYKGTSVKVNVEEVGGKVTDLFGNEQRYDCDIKGVIISNKIVHSEVVEV